MSTFQQPVAQPAMTISGNKNANNLPVGAEGREWSNGLFGCFGDCGTCCLAWFCPCIVYSTNKHRYESLTQSGAPDPTHGGPWTSGDCCLFAGIQACFGVGCILEIGVRSDIRRRYNISGSGVTDCLVSTFCLPCGLTQESREIGLEEESFGGVKA